MHARYELVIVGGPYDGAPGLGFSVQDAPEVCELPETIRIRRCPGGRRCGMTRCRAGHVAYWIPELEDVPTGAVEYELERESVTVVGGSGSARYVHGGLADWTRRRELAMAGA